MKIVSQEELDRYQGAVIKGGAKGTAIGLGMSLPLTYLLHKRWPYYRSLPPSLKALGIVTIVVPWCVIKAENAGIDYERQHWEGEKGYAQMAQAKADEQAHWDSLSSKDKITDWTSRNKYQIIAGSWVTSMAGSFGIIMRNPHQTFAQKVVQARVWAQGLTLAVVLASAGLSTVDRHKSKIVVDHSWRSQLEDVAATTKES